MNDKVGIIMGVDPGYDRCGLAVLDARRGAGGEKLLHSFCVQTDKNSSFFERLHRVLKEIELLIEKYEVQVVAIEKLFFNSNQKTAMRVAETRGAIFALALFKGLPLFEYTPLEIKKAITNSGRADKKAVHDMLKRLINLKNAKALDDEYDAIACALTCSATLKWELVDK